MKICKKEGHRYATLDESYSKRTFSRSTGESGTCNTGILYRRLFCPRCGDVIEVISQDRRLQGIRMTPMEIANEKR
uniref:Uncharacterized protein n=1 Tax=viral metagenome TaxID=1070528 RepID=A0A6H1ZU89_9ZZZZ